jgi:hypothetical protein
MRTAGDDAERSDEEERRMSSAGDDAERSDDEERRMSSAGDDAERSDEVGVPPACGGERRMSSAGDDAERSDEVERRMSRGCRDCQAGLDHCHGTIIRHWLHRSECTEEGCTSPELMPHAFVVDCDAVGCNCAEVGAPSALAI